MQVKAWLDAGGAAHVQNLTTGSDGGGDGGGGATRRTVAAVELVNPAAAHQVGGGGAPSTVSEVVATITLIGRNRDPYYPSCPKCKKKVTGDDAQSWQCEACQWSGPACVRRYMARLQIADEEGTCATGKRRGHTPPAWLGAEGAGREAGGAAKERRPPGATDSCGARQEHCQPASPPPRPPSSRPVRAPSAPGREHVGGGL